METTQSSTRNQSRLRTRLVFHWPAMRCVLTECVVNAILVEVGDVIANKSPQMLVVQWNYVIQ